MIYGKKPEYIECYEIDVPEMFFYQDMPIYIQYLNREIRLPKQLEMFEDLIERCKQRMMVENKLENYSYIYLSAKNLFISKDSNYNRFGWHSDGFLTDDINFIWCNESPTEYIVGEWTEKDIPQSHEFSIPMFNHLGSTNEIHSCKKNNLYKLDPSVIHRVAEYKGPPVMRAFVKVTFSKNIFNLKGNTHNYLIDYNWEMQERSATRNHPSAEPKKEKIFPVNAQDFKIEKLEDYIPASQYAKEGCGCLGMDKVTNWAHYHTFHSGKTERT